MRRISSTSRTETRRARYRAGRWSEWIAAALLMAKGYRILGLRAKTPKGEIDLIAVRGRRLAFVEVKRRLTLEDAEASITSRQRERVRQAALLWLRGTRAISSTISASISYSSCPGAGRSTSRMRSSDVRRHVPGILPGLQPQIRVTID